MKNFTKSLFIIVVLLVNSFIGLSQTDHHHEHKSKNGGDIDKFYISYEYSADSLVGFDEAAALEYARQESDEEWKQNRIVAVLKRNFVNFHYNLNVSRGGPIDNGVQAPCTNPGFETGTLAGWTAVEGPNNNSLTMAGCCPNATGQAVIVTPGPDANVAALPRVPPGGGGFACRIGNQTTGGVSYRLNQTFTVTATNSIFIYKYAVVLEDGSHACNEQPFFNVRFETCNNVVIPCAQYNVSAVGSLCTSGGDPNFITSGSYKYLPWQTRSFDLSAYIGQCVNIEFTVGGCVASQGAHAGYAYIDASCEAMTLNLNGTDIPVGVTTTGACAVGNNVLCAPVGFSSYTWSGPGATGLTGQCINPTQAGTYSVTLGMQGTSCQSPVLYSTFNLVPVPPLPDFSFTATPCGSSFNVPFQDNSTPNGGPAITNWYWDFDSNGSIDNTTQNPSNVFAGVGAYNVELKVSNGACSDSITKVVTISPSPTANFNLSSACLGSITSFTATSTPTAGIASHVWDYGDSSPFGNGLNTTHTYTSPGIKTVSYTVTTTSGCQSVFTKTLNVFPNPVVSIAANTVCVGLPTTFANTSNVTAPDNITGWSWDFDNNGTSDNSNQTPTNTYPSAGDYTAVLTATTNNGCVNSNTVAVKVNALPTATFTPIAACVNANVQLNNTSFAPPSDNITSYGWNFGAGANPATSTSSNPTPLIYSTSGVKTIILNITANTTCTASITQTVNVFPQPVANFSATSVCQGTATAFTDLSTPTGSITNWAWDYTNNNSTDNTTNAPTNLYPVSGTYSVSLIATSSNGCKDTIVLPINVWGHTIPNFIPNTVCFGSVSTFSNTTNTTTNSNIGGAPIWGWNFGDGNTSSAQDPTNTYTSTVTSSYNVTLTATTTNGCVDNVVKTVTVNPLPTATFTPVNACINANVALNNTSSIALPDNIANYAWTFGAGSAPATSTVQNPPTLSYNSSGIKSITLFITANTTCTATITQTVEVYAQPVANFSATAVCQGIATAYTDLSSPTGSITAWSWDFTNNGVADNSTNAPTNIFVTSGTFTTSLIVTDNHSCKDTIKLPIEVWGHTIPNFTPDKVCFGTSSVFTNLTDETSNPNVGLGTTYSWDFADGNASTLFSPSHTYVLGGNGNATYNVTLTATSLHNCVDNIVKTVSVFAIPTASFTSNEVCLGNATALTDASNGNGAGNIVNTYEWDFLNDGTVDITGVPNPNFTFPNFGNNPVSYTVSTSPVVGLVCKNTTNTITVWVNPNPVPDFTFVNSCINAQPNTFNGSPSTIAIGTNTAYVWAYGNGSVSAPSPASTSSFTYASPGVYSVTLTITSDRGCQKNTVKQVEVFAKPIFDIDRSPACDQQVMTFTAVVLPNSGTVSNWNWDLNNSITSIEATGQTISTTFLGAGQQTVNLIAITNNGCTDTITRFPYVNHVPVANFVGDSLFGCPQPKHCVNFTDLSPVMPGPSQIAQWQWSFGDGSIPVTNSSNIPVSHCYVNNSSSQVATFDISLQVVSDSGCVSPINTKLAYISVYPTPIANYVVNPNPGVITEPLVYFTNLSQDYTKWYWTFVGTGPFKVDSVNVNPTHFYDDPTSQVYFSNLIVQNQYGCADTAYVPIEIRPEFAFYIPNAFTPTNNDGINDYFTGVGIGIDKYEMWIFDRWGAMIYYTDDIKKGWDGRVQGKTAEGKQDVYTWKVKLRDVLGKNRQYIGHVTLLK